MRTGRVAEFQSFRFSTYRRLRITRRSRIKRHPAKSLPCLVLSLSLTRAVPVVEFYRSQAHRYLRLRFFTAGQIVLNQLPIFLKFLVQFTRRTIIYSLTQQQIIMEPVSLFCQTKSKVNYIKLRSFLLIFCLTFVCLYFAFKSSF